MNISAKNLFPGLIIFMLTIIPSMGFASKTKEPSKQVPIQTTSDRNGYLNIYGGRGFTYPMGDIAGDGGQKAHIADSDTAGISTGYIIRDKHIITIGISSRVQKIEIERNYQDKLMMTTVETRFINFDLAYRFQESWYYIGAGFYYGFPLGVWSRKNALDGEVTENLLYGDLETEAKNTMGMTLSTGLTFEISKNYYLNTGINILYPFTASYEANQDSIKVLDISICASISHKFNFSFF